MSKNKTKRKFPCNRTAYAGNPSNKSVILIIITILYIFGCGNREKRQQVGTPDFGYVEIPADDRKFGDLNENVKDLQYSDDDVIWMVADVDEEPLFDGKPLEVGFREHVNTHIIFPSQDDVSGRVVVEFIIEKDGAISNATVIRSLHPLFDAEALRVINTSPKWIPGKKQGKAVRAKLTFPVVFRLTSG